VAQHGGVLPTSVAGLLALKGIGRYTAGAVACFAYEQPVAMVDTNVRRVLSRVFEVDPGAVEGFAESVVPTKATAAYAWNQALMDLGATVCRAKRPMCLLCPLVAECGGPREPAKPKASGEFRGSQRYYRGRVVDFLSQLPGAARVSVDDLAAHTGPPAERERVVTLIHRLASEGLLTVDDDQRVRLPD